MRDAAGAPIRSTRNWAGRLLTDRRAPLVLLAVVCLFGVGLRAYRLGTPAASQGYVFDERYYVSAARLLAGSAPHLGDIYAGTAPAATDPNGEHPQLGKLIIAAGITVFGDGPVGWRITAVLFGALSILLLYWLVRCAGGTAWLALGAASLASVENLWLVHSRIAVLDIYVVPFMLAATAFYLRRQPIVAGALIGIGSCIKEFAAYTVLVVLVFELLRYVSQARRRHQSCSRDERQQIRRRALQLLLVALVAGTSYISLLAALDWLVTPYSGGRPVDRNQAAACTYLLIWSGACNHVVFMDNYAAKLRDPNQPQGIAASPVEFWLNRKAITYYKARRVSISHGRITSRTTSWFRGELSRVLLFTSWLAILMSVWWAARREDAMALLMVAWIVGIWLPTELFHLLAGRITYLYYMVVVMPALYIAVARLLSIRKIPSLLVLVWVVGFLADAASLYPLRTLG